MPALDETRYFAYTGTTPGFREELLYEYAIAFIEGETTRRFGGREERTEWLYGSDSVRLWLKEPPRPAEAESVEEDVEDAVSVDARRAGGEWHETGEWEVRGRSLVRLNGRQWDRRVEYRVTYETGYDTLPADIEKEVFDLIRYGARDLEAQPGLRSERIGDYQYTLADLADEPWSARMNRTLLRWRDNPA